MVPTMVFFEASTYEDSTIVQSHIWVQKEDEEWLMLYLAAQEHET
jgi:hypothetical protein